MIVLRTPILIAKMPPVYLLAGEAADGFSKLPNDDVAEFASQIELVRSLGRFDELVSEKESPFRGIAS